MPALPVYTRESAEMMMILKSPYICLAAVLAAGVQAVPEMRAALP